ncbi:hypothetical protein [Nocardia abscessus]|uniref:hypothetical protein n=1 Tax=Nocardia abscessus TaxID=120957 RepID=UPI002458D86E|nr:hypothetical protein [Nocardia abscessus]
MQVAEIPRYSVPSGSGLVRGNVDRRTTDHTEDPRRLWEKLLTGVSGGQGDRDRDRAPDPLDAGRAPSGRQIGKGALQVPSDLVQHVLWMVVVPLKSAHETIDRLHEPLPFAVIALTKRDQVIKEHLIVGHW